ncbi:hypothetical protein BJ085DRAFT_39307 [Dimargaris cristalligena]|uniref:FYVE zinc finger-domain-containing protein n=1 Tax=Dimargaris cristalligena TaxID=215637 RepID=A0A4P9ZP40_9FUNG|nr:hypothetical protein BJ085DRAFT_39307 [Dimargaris cristalligena]|eukprot:RKP34401.1 hypothetical protein BJ085DRAFT_39307 [Dimargaris cristalligena]
MEPGVPETVFDDFPEPERTALRIALRPLKITGPEDTLDSDDPMASVTGSGTGRSSQSTTTNLFPDVRRTLTRFFSPSPSPSSPRWDNSRNATKNSSHINRESLSSSSSVQPPPLANARPQQLFSSTTTSTSTSTATSISPSTQSYVLTPEGQPLLAESRRRATAPGLTCRPPFIHTLPILKDPALYNACYGCGLSFNLLRPKHHCRNCGSVLCAACTPHRWLIPKFLYNDPAAPARVCAPCDRFLALGLLDAETLGNVPTRLLQAYARAYELPILGSGGGIGRRRGGLMEKAELAHLIHSAQPLADRYERAYRRNHIPIPCPRPAEAVVNDQTWSFTRPLTAAELEGMDSLIAQLYGNNFGAEHTSGDWEGFVPSATPPTSHRPTGPTPAHPRETPPPSSSSSTPAAPPAEPKPQPPPPTIAAIIANRMDIAQLPARQLKVILDEHYIDHRDVIEKSDLVQKVRTLVDNTRAELAEYTRDPDNNENSCRVCFDSLINSIILECGHMATCMDCAKRLQTSTNECPICRQRITRVVHVFKT